MEEDEFNLDSKKWKTVKQRLSKTNEIQGLLQVILNETYLAKTEVDAAARISRNKNLLKNLFEIETNAMNIGMIISDLHDLVRPLRLNSLKLRTLIENILKPISLPPNIQVDIKIPTEAEMVLADPYFLSGCIRPLVLNALEAMQNGGKLAVTARQEVDNYVIEIEDTGKGIPSNIRYKLFNSFFTTKRQNMGFGLTFAKHSIEKMDGTITFQSEIGNGTKFQLRLPSLR